MALFLTVILLATAVVDSLTSPNNSRHVCLFQSFSLVRGPYFNALFDQMMQQTGLESRRIAFLTIDKCFVPPSNIHNDLDLDASETFRLDLMNPIELMKGIQNLDPTVLWATTNSESALKFRYYMRTSGFDGIVENLCGSMDQNSLLFIAEGAVVTCAGSDMGLAKRQDPAPEPQFRGLELLGPDTSITFDTVPGSVSDVASLDDDKVYVWSQQYGNAVSFLMVPSQRGAIEEFQNRNPLPPLVEEIFEGRKCVGEPAIDPSRMLQMQGDSEWFEEYH